MNAAVVVVVVAAVVVVGTLGICSSVVDLLSCHEYPFEWPAKINMKDKRLFCGCFIQKCPHIKMLRLSNFDIHPHRLSAVHKAGFHLVLSLFFLLRP